MKRGKVAQSITDCVAIAFVILQLVDIVPEPLRLPVSATALIMILLTVGLIITIVGSGRPFDQIY